ncbi:uncharacterized protein BP5553_01701 [Venustampulla echinocandica]|uniref:Uncharacterized protein n=1 Tax=Venustampulla echinocandica TaxID=2656787 RepID=A0A370U1Q8_9HELO|nr:uncharacterized protein BP5553_01701 [Venustampulla echinocandica]RDL41722.1 hypothetical protein BP5553_01701 [Venustampulla echinocandica]
MAPHVVPPTTPAEYTRLHITPLNPDLLTTIIPPSILPSARNISYATIQTFPEKSYGFVDLPIMDAEKLKKKLNGSILKGTKIRIEKSRPKKEISVEEPEEPAEVHPKRPKTDLSKKRKRGDETVPGIEIGERHVKRGWTTPLAAGKSSKDKEKDQEKEKDKKKTKSKYTTDPECLFKTILPPNVAANTKSSDVKLEKKKRIKAGTEAVVHEFSKTTKYATFLRDRSGSGNTKGVTEFVEGKGWVDEGGNVIEQVVTKSRKAPEPKKVGSKPNTESAKPHKAGSKAHADSEDESDTSEEGTSDDSSASEDEPDHVATVPSSSKVAASKVVEDSETSTSGSSSEDSDSDSDDSSEDSSDVSEEESEDTVSDSSEDVTESSPVSRPQSSSNPAANLSIKIPGPEAKAIPINTEVHPLEALYKRPKVAADTESAPKPTASSFSFFGADTNGDVDMEEETHDRVPTTPFTQRDFEYRGIRSAAPTPDTAHANKRFLWPTSNDEEDEEEEDEVHGASSPIRSQGAAGKAEATETPESDFQKWFYEHRGDTNRAWKKRRKIVGKEKRHRDNKKRQDRAI